MPAQAPGIPRQSRPAPMNHAHQEARLYPVSEAPPLAFWESHKVVTA